MLTSQQIAQFHADGFLNGGQVLSDEEVETLREEVMRVIDERERNDIPQPVRVRQYEPRREQQGRVADCQYLGSERAFPTI